MTGIVCIGGSRGSIPVIRDILSDLPPDLKTPVVVVVHRHVESCDVLLRMLHGNGNPSIVETFDKQPLSTGGIFLAPPDYHVLVDRCCLRLTTDAPDPFARPGIDQCFLTAAWAFGAQAVAVVLSGNNTDGAKGAARIQAQGGRVMVEDPTSASAPQMPQATLKLVHDATVLHSADIGAALRAQIV